MVLHFSFAAGHLGWNLQPVGGLPGSKVYSADGVGFSEICEPGIDAKSRFV